jgi:hypothetical protein
MIIHIIGTFYVIKSVISWCEGVFVKILTRDFFTFNRSLPQPATLYYKLTIHPQNIQLTTLIYAYLNHWPKPHNPWNSNHLINYILQLANPHFITLPHLSPLPYKKINKTHTLSPLYHQSDTPTTKNRHLCFFTIILLSQKTDTKKTACFMLFSHYLYYKSNVYGIFKPFYFCIWLIT